MDKKITAKEAAEIAFSYREKINVDNYVDLILSDIIYASSIGKGSTVIATGFDDVEQVLIGFKLKELGYSFKWEVEHGQQFLTVYWIA